MLRIRTSSLNQIAMCAASAYDPALIAIAPSGEPARLGNACHEFLRHYAYSGAVLETGLLSQEHRVDEDELGYLCYAGRKAWDAIEAHFPSPQCEQSFSWVDEDAGIVLAGHPDVFSLDGDRLKLADWKSGFLWTNCEPQLRGYAWLISQEFPIRTVEAMHMNIRLGEMEVFRWTIDELAAWWADMAKRIDAGRESYSPNYEACRYCKRFRECPAGEDLARQAITFMSGTKSAVMAEMSVDAYQRARFVEAVAKEVVDYIRVAVAQAGGELTSADGKTLAFRREKREKIDAKAGWKDMLAALTVSDVLDSMTVGKTKLLDAVRANAPRGTKKTAADGLMDRLRESGAVTETFIEKLELRRAPAKALAAPEPELIEQTV